jgi:hypothetical protein
MFQNRGAGEEANLSTFVDTKSNQIPIPLMTTERREIVS